MRAYYGGEVYAYRDHRDFNSVDDNNCFIIKNHHANLAKHSNLISLANRNFGLGILYLGIFYLPEGSVYTCYDNEKRGFPKVLRTYEKPLSFKGLTYIMPPMLSVFCSILLYILYGLYTPYYLLKDWLSRLLNCNILTLWYHLFPDFVGISLA